MKMTVKKLLFLLLAGVFLLYGCGSGNYANDTPSEEAVSYTHLDVYKRQSTARADWSCSSVHWPGRAPRRMAVVLVPLASSGRSSRIHGTRLSREDRSRDC